MLKNTLYSAIVGLMAIIIALTISYFTGFVVNYDPVWFLHPDAGVYRAAIFVLTSIFSILVFFSALEVFSRSE